MNNENYNESESDITNLLDRFVISRFHEYNIELSRSDALQLIDLYIRGTGLYDIFDDDGNRTGYQLYMIQLALSLRTHFATHSNSINDIIFNDDLIIREQTDILYYYDNLDYCTIDRSIIENNMIPILTIIPDFINSCHGALYQQLLNNTDLDKYTYYLIGDDTHPCFLSFSIRRIDKDITDDAILTIVSNATSMVETDKIKLINYSFKPEYMEKIKAMVRDYISIYYKKYVYKVDLNNEEK